MKRTKRLILAIWIFAAFAGGRDAIAGPTLEHVKKSGMLACGVAFDLSGFSRLDSQGRYTGLNVDLCKALAAAVLSEPDKVRFVPLSAQQRFTTLQSGEIDVLLHNATDTLSRDAQLGINF